MMRRFRLWWLHRRFPAAIKTMQDIDSHMEQADIHLQRARDLLNLHGREIAIIRRKLPVGGQTVDTVYRYRKPS